jgi:hypothetical protein
VNKCQHISSAPPARKRTMSDGTTTPKPTETLFLADAGTRLRSGRSESVLLSPHSRGRLDRHDRPSAITMDQHGNIEHHAPPPGTKRLDAVVEVDQPRPTRGFSQDIWDDGLAGAPRGARSAPQVGSAEALDEIVAGYRAGNVNWDVRRMGPPPGTQGWNPDRYPQSERLLIPSP